MFKNKKANFEYFLFDKFEAGIVLTGMEVKSIRIGGVDISNSYISISKNMECVIMGMNIKKLENAHKYDTKNYIPTQTRKLLLKKNEILKLFNKSKIDGFSIIPTMLYFNKRGFVKIEISLAKGKKLHDKRQTIKERDLNRQNRKI